MTDGTFGYLQTVWLKKVRVAAIIAVVGVVASIALSAVGLVHAMRARSTLQAFLDDVDVEYAELELIDRWTEILSWTGVGVSLVAGIAFVVWFLRIRYNAGELRPELQRRSPSWCFWGWFCPVVCLWFPLQIAQDASRVHPNGARREKLIGWWWGAWIGQWVPILIADALSRSETAEGYLSTQLWMMIANAETIGCGVLAILVIRELTDAQQSVIDEAEAGNALRWSSLPNHPA